MLMATHSSILAWKIPWAEEPGYSPWGRRESDTTEWLSTHIQEVNYLKNQFSSVPQSCPTFVTPWTAGSQSSLSITNSWSLFKLMSIESVMPSNHLILCHPLLLLPSVFPSIRVFSNESVLWIMWQIPFNEYWGLTSFRMYQFDLLAVQGTPKNLLQNHSSKASILKQQQQQNKSINSLALSFLCSPTLTSIHDYWKKHGFD